ncbi:MAG: hypothetical protein ACRCTR_06295 [Actinomycetota bacterium]
MENSGDASRTPAPAEDSNPATTQDRRQLIQHVVLRVHASWGGAPPQEIVEALENALSEAGLPEQPGPWVAATAAEIAANRIVVVDPRDEQVNDVLAARQAHNKDHGQA